MKKFMVAMIAGLGLALGGQAFAAPVNINTAAADELDQSLIGVGPSKAAAIVADRQANGPFASADDLTRVKGIGPATVERNRVDILVKSAQ
ncbi:MAG: helix-hairpin-helix domain-containing protein [Chromatiales bacterium]|nr:helix-hairpin-helix domain-containing protein [Chromatiales bacterium]